MNIDSESQNKPTTTAEKAEKKENFFINLAFNIAIPAIILAKFSGEAHFGPTLGLIIALAFPLSYGSWDFVSRKKVNFFSVLGLISTLLTGTISLLELDPKYIAIKEAAIPGILFVIVLVSTWTPYSLVEKILLNDSIFDMPKLQACLQKQQEQAAMNHALKISSYLIAASFAFSSLLNYLLATFIVVSQPGSEAYNAQLGKLTALSFPVIALPCTLIMTAAMFYLFHKIHKITGEDIEQFLRLGK